MAELNKVFIQNVLTIVVNDLLANDLISLEFDLTKHNIFGGFKVVEYDGINLATIFHVLPSMQIQLQVSGRKLQDCPYDKAEFHVTGYLQIRTTKYIMDLPPFPDPLNHPFLKINSNYTEINQWIDKYKKEEIEPNGFAKSGNYVLY